MNETQLGPNPPSTTAAAWTISSNTAAASVANPTLPLIVSSGTAQQQQQQQLQQQHAPTPTSDRAPLSLYERVRHFLYVNFLVNKVSFVLSILAYMADVFLFVALNLYLFSNVAYLYELACVRLPPPPHHAFFSSSLVQNVSSNTAFNASMSSENAVITWPHSKFTSSIKQSYLTLQIISLFVFFICFILAGLIRLQFKYHRLALNLYDIDLEGGGGGVGVSGRRRRIMAVAAAAAAAANVSAAIDRDGGDSLASSTTGSHFSSSMSKRLTTLLKRMLHRLLTKIASILLYVTMGYHFCQNCFIDSSNSSSNRAAASYTIVMHVCIGVAVVLRTAVRVLAKRNELNKLDEVKRLQRKQNTAETDYLYGGVGSMKQQHPAVPIDEFELAPAPPPRGTGPATNGARKRYESHNYYSYYYTYLIKYNQSAFNQLKQHQQNQTQFRVFHLNDVSLLVGFTLALFHLFAPGKAIQLIFVFAPILCALVLFRLKSMLNGVLSLVIMFVVLFYLSSFSSAAVAARSSLYSSLNLTSVLDKTFPDDNCGGNHSTIRAFEKATNTLEVNFYGLNLLTLASFLVTLYLKSALGIYYCTLTSLERWNLAFLSSMHHIWRHVIVWSSLAVYVTFALVCAVALVLNTLHSSWRLFVFFPAFVLVALVWCAFELLNTVNLLHLLNKISDCFLLLNESSNGAGAGAGGGGVHSSSSGGAVAAAMAMAAGGENTSNHSRKSKSNRQSTLSQHSQSNHNLSSGSVSNSKTTRCSLRKLLSTFLNYHKLNVNEETTVHPHPAFNIPIHRILNYKGVRHLGSISYRISLYCLVLALTLSLFAFVAHSSSHPITLGLYATTLSLSLIYLSLLYQFPATQTGSCIAYVCVAPPLAFNIYQTHTMSSNNGGGTNGGGGGGGGAGATMTSANSATTSGSSSKTGTTTTSSKSSRTANSTMAASTTATNAHGAGGGGGSGSGATGMFMPFNYQQALQHRCAYLLQRIQAFLQFHLIDNFGCDLAPANGFRKSVLEAKLLAFFRKRAPPCGGGGGGLFANNEPSATTTTQQQPTNSYYNTYLLYYCGPTSPLTDALAFVDGAELGLDEIIALWKQVHCQPSQVSSEAAAAAAKKLKTITTKTAANAESATGPQQPMVAPSASSSDEETLASEMTPKVAVSSSEKKSSTTTRMGNGSTKSRLIIILDAENTSKSLEYVRSKCREANVYVALQTAKYNYLGTASVQSSTKEATDATTTTTTTTTLGNKSTMNSKQQGGVENRLLSSSSSSTSKRERSGRKLFAQQRVVTGPPGSPQTLVTHAAAATAQNFFDSYLNMGKFTLDWIKSNSNAAASVVVSGSGSGSGGPGGGVGGVGVAAGGVGYSNSYDAGTMAGIGDFDVQPHGIDTFYMKTRDFDIEHAHLQEDVDEDDDEDDEDVDDESSSDSDEEDNSSQDSNEAVAAAATAASQQPLQPVEHVPKKPLKVKSTAPLAPPLVQTATSATNAAATIGGGGGYHNTHQHQQSAASPGSSFFYEAKCAFSHYWLDFSFDSAATAATATAVTSPSELAADLTQFWNIYYPCRVCRPLLAMVNCPLFYVRLEPLRKIFLWVRRLKARLIPVHEFETGHGFKLFSS